MATRTILSGVIGGCLTVALLWGCAAAPASDAETATSSETGAATRPPADPLFRRTFTTPRGGEWDFVLGGGYSSDR